jgi:hypothetical protein
MNKIKKTISANQTKLTLAMETLKILAGNELQHIHGGVPINTFTGCVSDGHGTCETGGK